MKTNLPFPANERERDKERDRTAFALQSARAAHRHRPTDSIIVRKIKGMDDTNRMLCTLYYVEAVATFTSNQGNKSYTQKSMYLG